MKIIKLFSVAIIVLNIVSSAYATAPGPYLGLQAVKKSSATSSGGGNSLNNYAGRIYLGGDFNKYAGMEFGISQFLTRSKSCGKYQSMMDLQGKGNFSLGNGFGVFGKAGVAGIRVGSCTKNNSVTTTGRLIAGLGVSYDLTQSWMVDLSWSHIFSNGGTIPKADLTALGISYHFVDHYCGQFIC